MADQLDVKGARDFRYNDVDFNPMFVLVQVLERGQYFVSCLLSYRRVIFWLFYKIGLPASVGGRKRGQGEVGEL